MQANEFAARSTIGTTRQHSYATTLHRYYLSHRRAKFAWLLYTVNSASIVWLPFAVRRRTNQVIPYIMWYVATSPLTHSQASPDHTRMHRQTDTKIAI